jgi:hypothetical protein
MEDLRLQSRSRKKSRMRKMRKMTERKVNMRLVREAAES